VRRKETEVDRCRSVSVADSKQCSVVICMCSKWTLRGGLKIGTENIRKSTCFPKLEQAHNSCEITVWHTQSRPTIYSPVSVFLFKFSFRRYPTWLLDFRHEKRDWLQLSRLLRMTNGIVVQLQVVQLNLLLKFFFFPPVVELVPDET
jgi:hypothetical protein